MNQPIKIIIFIIGLFILSSSFLFFINDRYLNSENKKDFWAVYFMDPKNTNLDFVIENHSRKNNFQWSVNFDAQNLNPAEVIVQQGERKIIHLINKNFGKKIIITVTDGEIKKEIYKNL